MADVDETRVVEKLPWAKPTFSVLVAGWFGDSTQDGIHRDTYYEFSPHYPTGTSNHYVNPPS